MDINKILLTGVAETAPILSVLPQSQTPVCSFTLRVNEGFFTNDRLALRPNFFRVESLGRIARVTYDKVRVGCRYLVDGYLRQENSNSEKFDIIKVRAYAIILDLTTDTIRYQEGLRRALQLLERHRSVAEATRELKEMLSVGSDPTI